MTLTGAERTLIRLSVAIVQGRFDLVRELRARAGGEGGEPNRAWREAVLQTHLFAGFPRVVEACAVLAEAGGLGTLDDDERGGNAEDPRAGRALFDRIYGDSADGVRGRIEEQHPVLAAWIESHAYGRVLVRAGLTPARRELFSVACLTALAQDRQLASHVRGALRCGATRAEVDETLSVVAELVDEETMRHAWRVVERFATE
jgi:alkylhydroperoxidase/carboxymuconolactone decarboxylase family protein YurZ